ncbi:MAG: DUF1847 domain-containing protein [Eubacterium sp.]|jgi:Uncharacterized metal-binding protein conserved in archaea|nr:DUF1847 domain-containing protein [Eubacterium sp.]
MGERKDDIKRSCIDCGYANCNKQDRKFPDFCTTTHLDGQVMEEALACYEEEDVKRLTVAAAEVESEHYCQYNRVEEIVAFAKKLGAKKIGIATCVGLLSESRTLAKIFRSHGFEVAGIGCKAGTVQKVEVGIPKKCENTGINMCNPIFQAKMLNKEKTDLNVLVGLCVGHDSLFYKYSDAYVTTAVTKDRVLAHNPAAALYTCASYYGKMMGDAGAEKQ